MYKINKTECLKGSDCTRGLRVKLAWPDPKYQLGGANPAMDTEWECEGTIRKVYDNYLYVTWDNGYENTYKDDELIRTNDSGCGTCRSIWS